MTIVYCPIYHSKFRSCVPKDCIPCFSKHCVPYLERFNSALVYYVDSANDYIQSGKYKNLFKFNTKKNSSSTQTDLNYISIDCDGCEVKSPTNDWDIV